MSGIEKVVHTQCHICEQICGLAVTSVDGEIVSILPDKQNPYTWRDFCIRGSSSNETRVHANRITAPMRRRDDGTYIETTYEEAINDIAARLRGLIRDHGPHSIADYIGNAAALSFLNSRFANAFFSALGSRNRFYVGSIDHNAHLLISRLMYGTPAVALQTDIDECDLLLLMGSNPAVSGMNWMGRVPDGWAKLQARMRDGMELIVVDPRRSETAARATQYVPIRPEADWALLLGMIKVILEEKLESIKDCWDAANFDRLQAIASSAQSEFLADQCGATWPAIEQLARRFARARTASCVVRTGSAQGRGGALAEWLAHSLNIVTGRLDKPGCRFQPSFPVNLMALPVAEASTTPSRVRGLLPVENTYSLAELPDEILTPGQDKIRALFINGGNPVVTGPDGDRLDAALAELDLLVAIDLFQRDSHRHAHWLLPGSHFLERDEIHLSLHSTNVEAFVRSTRAAVPSPTGIRSEWQIWRDLAEKLDLVLFDGRHEATPEAFMRSMLDRDGNVTLEEVIASEHGIYRGKHKFGNFHSSLRTHDKCIDICPESLALALELRLNISTDRLKPDQFQIITRRTKHMMNSWLVETTAQKTRTNRSNVISICPDDAERLGLASGELVNVASSSATLAAVVEVSPDVRQGVAVMEHGWGSALYDPTSGKIVSRTGINRNRLVNGSDLDPLTGVPALNGTVVTVKKASASAHLVAGPQARRLQKSDRSFGRSTN